MVGAAAIASLAVILVAPGLNQIARCPDPRRQSKRVQRERSAILADSVAEIESKLAVKERNKTGINQHTEGGLSDTVADKPTKPKKDTRAKTAKAAKVSERQRT